ncbi:MAG: branched-chain amino acid ABC transporter permease [Geodermatophilaceae bacterium]|nr:branched-chain amino acid ABC transporter permease [Geodermatophilaceae bacterium]
MLIQQLVNGLLLGTTFALIALSFNLVVGALDRLNFALGETAMVSAICGSLFLSRLDLPFVLAFLVSLAVGALIAGITFLLSFRFVSAQYHTAPILSSLGVGLVITSLVTRLLGSDQRRVPSVLEGVRIEIGPLRIVGDQLIILAVAALMTVLLYGFLNRTPWGTAIRGVSDDPDMAGLLGVPVQRVILLTFVVSGTLAGASGLLTGLSFHTVSPFTGFETTLTALMVIVLGGLGNITGGVVAGLMIGVIETMTVAYLSATYRDLIVFLLVGITLVARPQGLFTRNTGVVGRV